MLIHSDLGDRVGESGRQLQMMADIAGNAARRTGLDRRFSVLDFFFRLDSLPVPDLPEMLPGPGPCTL